MELEELRHRWLELERKLDRALHAHEALLRQNALRGTRRRIDRQAVWPALDLVFGAVVLLVAGASLGDHWPDSTLVAPAAVLMVAAGVFLADNVRQLALVAGIDWERPVSEIQRELGNLRYARIRQFRWVILTSPLVGFLGLIVGVEFVIGLNIVTTFDPWWVASNVLFGVLFIPAGMAVARAMGRRWRGSEFWRRVLDGVSGESLAVARRELDRWAAGPGNETGRVD